MIWNKEENYKFMLVCSYNWFLAMYRRWILTSYFTFWLHVWVWLLHRKTATSEHQFSWKTNSDWWKWGAYNKLNITLLNVLHLTDVLQLRILALGSHSLQKRPKYLKNKQQKAYLNILQHSWFISRGALIFVVMVFWCMVNK